MEATHQFIVATRSSPLAMAQARQVVSYLQGRLQGAEFQLLPMTTKGDQQLNWSLSKQGGKGLFTQELEVALLEGRAHIAVHSAKDMPTERPRGLVIAGFLPRAAAHDVCISRLDCQHIERIATSSPRRQAQMQRVYPSATFLEIRGNVETRLRKMTEGYADATVMAAAGLERLGISQYQGLRFEPLDIAQMVPAPGQGAIAIECTVQMAAQIAPLCDLVTGQAVMLERAILQALGGGCHSAFAAYYDGVHLYLYHDSVGYRQIPLEFPLQADIHTWVQMHLPTWLSL